MSISLATGQRISLDKEAGVALSAVRMGLGWDVAKSKGFFGGGSSIDLDASCGVFDAERNLLDVVWFAQLVSNDGSIRHSGDNLTGAGDGDDETILVDLSRVPPAVKSLVFTVNSYRGQSFDTVQNAFCRIVNPQSGVEVARYNLSAQGGHTAMVMAKLYRHNDEWKMHAIGETASGRTFQDIVPAIAPHL
jgi:tellurium resistance protein TerZ